MISTGRGGASETEGFSEDLGGGTVEGEGEEVAGVGGGIAAGFESDLLLEMVLRLLPRRTGCPLGPLLREEPWFHSMPKSSYSMVFFCRYIFRRIGQFTKSARCS